MEAFKEMKRVMDLLSMLKGLIIYSTPSTRDGLLVITKVRLFEGCIYCYPEADVFDFYHSEPTLLFFEDNKGGSLIPRLLLGKEICNNSRGVIHYYDIPVPLDIFGVMILKAYDEVLSKREEIKVNGRSRRQSSYTFFLSSENAISEMWYLLTEGK
jgi:hypothetical protein